MSRSTEAAVLADHIHALSRMLRQSIEAEAQRLSIPLTPPQILVMETLVRSHREGTELSLSELSNRLGLAHSTVSGIVSRLERRGLVHRTTWAEDRRQIRIQLTDQVRTWLNRELPQLRQQPLTAALQRLGKADTAALVDGLARLRELLEEH